MFQKRVIEKKERDGVVKSGGKQAKKLRSISTSLKVYGELKKNFFTAAECVSVSLLRALKLI